MRFSIKNAPAKNVPGRETKDSRINPKESNTSCFLLSLSKSISGKKYIHNRAARISVEYCLKMTENLKNTHQKMSVF